MSRTEDQDVIVNTIIRLTGYLQSLVHEKEPTKDSDDQAAKDALRLVGQALIDLNRIANALETIAQAQAVTALNAGQGGKSPILGPNGSRA